MTTPTEKLGEILLQKGLLTPVQLSECLKESKSGGRKGTESDLTDIVVSRGYVDRETMKSIAHPSWKSIVDPSTPTVEIPEEVAEARKDPKRILQKYTLLNELGRGGMAVVYRAWDELLRTYVALKLIRSQDIGLADTSKENEVQEFVREARTAIKLSHPHIVRVYEFGRHDDRYFLSMEYIEGKNLEALLHPSRRQAPWQEFVASPRRFLLILHDVAIALDYAHHQRPPIVHRDVKPQNILVDGTGRACVVDFGLAKEMKSGSTITVSGIVKGTPCYMAPEQALGRAVDARTDVWALGAILYEFLAGIPPFMAPTQREILNKVVNEEPSPPSELHRSRGSGVTVTPNLEKICLKALEKDKAKRYATAAEFAGELARHLSGEKVRAKGVAGYERAMRRAGRNKGIVIAVAAAVLMGIVAAVALLRDRDPERIVERVVVESAADARLREASEKIQAIASEMQYDKAKRGYQELIDRVEPGKARDALKGELEEIRLQEALIADLAGAIRDKPRTYARFTVKGQTLYDLRLLDATTAVLIGRHSERAVELAWGQLTDHQFVTLIEEFGDALSGDARLGFISWCLRRSRSDDAMLAARALRGKPEEAAAERILARAGLIQKPEKAPEPVRKPAPAPAPEPEPAPPTPAPVVKAKAPAPAPPPPEPKLPPSPAWTYKPEWKHLGLPLAVELGRRGWDDLAEELVLNALHAPDLGAREKDEATLAKARLWAMQATRDPGAEAAAEKQVWAIRTIESLLGRTVDREARSELGLLYSARGRAFMAAGRTMEAMNAFSSFEKNARLRAEDLEKDERAQLTLPNVHLAWKEEWCQAKLATALAILAEAEAHRSISSKGALATRAYERLLTYLEGDALWQLEGTAAGVHAGLLRNAALHRLGRVMDGPSGVKAWLADPILTRSEAGRWLIPRGMLFDVGTRPQSPDKATAAKMNGDVARALEEMFRKLPQARDGEVGQQLQLQLALAHARSSKGAAAVLVLKSLPGLHGIPALKSAAVRILLEAGTPESKQFAAELGVAPAETDPPVAFGYLQELVPAGATAGPVQRVLIQRTPAGRETLVAKGGGTRATESSVLAALKWLAHHQNSDGSWSAESFGNHCVGGKCGGPGSNALQDMTMYSETRLVPFERRQPCAEPEEELAAAAAGDGQVGVTGLALLAFLGAGYTPDSKESYLDPASSGRTLRFGDAVKRGLQALIRVQDPEGCIGERNMRYMFTHTISGLALIEAYGLTGWTVLKDPAQKALDFTVAAQNPGKGWRYSFKCGDNDSAVSGWAVQLLRAAELAELAFPKSAYDGALNWFNEATEQSGYFQVGYSARSTSKVYIPGQNEQFDHHASMTASGVLSRIFIQKKKGDPALAGVNLLVSDLPEWKTNKIDTYYWYFTTMALFQYDGPDGPFWKKWVEPMKNAIVPNQRTGKDGCRNGSWDPEQERWGAQGGRVYETAINALTLETFYRYAPSPEIPRKR
jgi:serine/threonine protein kinase